MSTVDFDGVLKRVGSRGWFQKRIFFFVCLPVALPSTFLVFSNVFVSATPDHWCRLPPNLTRDGESLTPERIKSLYIPQEVGPDGEPRYSRCFQYDLSGPNETSVVPCKDGWEYDKSLYEETLVTEFDLVCDKSWMPPLSTTLFYTGSLLGNTFFGWASDRWGRRTVFYPVVVSEVLLSVGTSFCLDYWAYTAVRAVRGLFFPAIFQLAFILCLELTGPSERSAVTAAMCGATALAAAALALLAMAARRWRALSLLTSLPLLPLLGSYWILPESPRWLLTKNRVDEAEAVVRRMAALNGRRLPPDYLASLQKSEAAEVRGGTRTSPWDLFRYPSIRYKYLIVCLNWVACAVSYNALAYYTTHLGINDYLAFFSNSMVEVPSYFVMGWFMDKYGRRPSLVLSMLLGGAACTSSIFIGRDGDAARLTAALLGKFGCSAAFSVFYVYVAELLPTVLRGQAMGVGAFVSGLALLGFPAVVSMAEERRSLPLVVIGLLSTAAGLLAALLPETRDRPLPQYALELRPRGTEEKDSAGREKLVGT